MARFTRRSVLAGSTALAGLAASGLPALGQARDRAVVRVARDIQNLDPAFRIGPIEGNVMRAVYQRLASFKAGSLDYENDAAAELKQVNDQLIEFRLKDGLTFQGGYGDVTAEDVKFSFERFNSATNKDGKKSSYASDWGALDKVEVTGKTTGKIHLKRPAPALFRITICDGSGAIVSQKAFDKLGDQVATQAIGSGVYTMAEWRANDRLVLKANPDYKGPKPSLSEITIKPVSDFKTAELAFRTNEIQFTEADSGSADGLAKVADSKIIQLDGMRYVWIGMNTEKKPLDNVKVRQAIRLAIDVDSAVAAAYNGKAKRANTMIQPSLLGHWKDAPVYKRDIAQAKRLLAEAGYPNGFKISLAVLNTAAFRTIAQVAQASLAEAGIDCRLDIQEAGTYFSLGRGDAGKNLELSLQQFSAKMDPSFTSQWFVSSQVGVWNWQRWANAEFDKLHEMVDSTIDPAKRAAGMVRMQQLMDESAAYVWLTYDTSLFATKSWLNPGILPNGTDWQYEHFKSV
ncbi:MAG: ABC transporter substrate-binding protein [Alphaproteobacteria bacterium]|nr:ABC transporter substrate-binding protein [Alphaproteobacteria bacterium]